MNDPRSLIASPKASPSSEMLQELSNMDRITQLQDEIQFLLTIMSRSIQYLTSRVDFLQVDEAIPVTKQRNPERFDPPDVFEGNQKELVSDLILKAKQVEYLINSLPEPEPEELQAKRLRDLEGQMEDANEAYRQALTRAKRLHSQISDVLGHMLTETSFDSSQKDSNG